MKCSTWVQSQKQQNDLGSFFRHTIQHHFDQTYAPTTDAEEAEVNQFYEDLQDLLELTLKKKKMSFSSYGVGVQKKDVK